MESPPILMTTGEKAGIYDLGLEALRIAAFKAEEAAARLQKQTTVIPPPSSSSASRPSLHTSHVGFLTPEDSSEDNSGPVNSRSAVRDRGQQTPPRIPSPVQLPSSGPNSTPKKRGRPRTSNAIDRIVGAGDQSRSVDNAKFGDRSQPRAARKLQHRERLLPPHANGSFHRPSSQESRLKTSDTVQLKGQDQQGAQNGRHGPLEGVQENASSEPISKHSEVLKHDQQRAYTKGLQEVPSIIDESQEQLAQENRLLKTMFTTDISPIMHASMLQFEGKLPRDALIAVGKAFAGEIINKKLRCLVRSGQQVVTPPFKQSAIITIQRMLLEKMEEIDGQGGKNAAFKPNWDLVATSSQSITLKHDPLRDVLSEENMQKGSDIDKNKARFLNTDDSATPPIRRSECQETYIHRQPLNHVYRATALDRPRVGPRIQNLELSEGAVGNARLLTALYATLPSPNNASQQLEHTLKDSHQPSEADYKMPKRLRRHPRYVGPETSESDYSSESSHLDRNPGRDTQGRDQARTYTNQMANDLVDLNLTHYVPVPRTRSTASILRSRELGFGKWLGPQINVQGMNEQLRMHFAERLACWRSWTGASKDVVTAVWAPNGNTYALGASADMDNLNIQYNRPNNLLFGNIDANTLTELPDHHVNRPRPETIETGDNAREDTYNSVDHELYTTVSHVCFGQDNDRLYSASFDKTVKIWDLTSFEAPACVETLRHDAQVELLAVSSNHVGLLASGQRTLENSIRVYDLDYLDLEDRESSEASIFFLGSSRAKRSNLYPTCLLWGRIECTSSLLLAGYAESRSDTARDQEGDICLWDVETQQSLKVTPSTQAIHDIAWHPNLPVFAAATATGSRSGLASRQTRSLIRTWQPFEASGRIMEYECPAYDINDVRFHPFDDHYISAGCTNGITYIWDARMPDNILHRLPHGLPIDEQDRNRTREEQDTGVRFTAWDRDGLNFYTGSSDGVIKCWDIFKSTEDALVRDVAQFDAAVMTGTFSPDYTNLLVGLSKGAVHILSTAPLTHNDDEDSNSTEEDIPSKAYEPIRHVPQTRPSPGDSPTGVEAANQSIESGQITIHSTFGAGKGPKYDGPFADWARPRGVDSATGDMVPDILASQLDASERRRGRKLGGKPDRDTRERYREAVKVAHERNFLPFHFKENNRGAKKRELPLIDDGHESTKAGARGVGTMMMMR